MSELRATIDAVKAWLLENGYCSYFIPSWSYPTACGRCFACGLRRGLRIMETIR